MAVPGILTSSAGYSQAKLAQTERDLTLNGRNLAVPIRTQSGSGGGAVFAKSTATMNAAIRALDAQGSHLLRLAPAQFQSDYTGHLLAGSYHLLDPQFTLGGRVDFHG